MKLLLLLIMMLVTTQNTFSQELSLDNLPYNTKSHSVKQHCKTIATTYAVWFDLTRKEGRSLYNDLRALYYNRGVQNVSADGLHAFIREKIKAYLTVKQYETFQNM